MPRRREIQKRKILPDPKHHDRVITKFINNLMEDAATAEISRSQIWQWIRHGSLLEDDTIVTADLVRREIANQMDAIADELGYEAFTDLPFEEARRVFEQVTLSSEFVEFLTLPAYELLD